MAELIFPRGNSKDIFITIKVNGEEYTLAEGETAIFTVKERKDVNSPVKLQKQLTAADYNDEGELVVQITPEDTVNWKTGEEGKEYYWDFAVRLSSSRFFTPITDGVLLLTPACGDIGDIKNNEE